MEISSIILRDGEPPWLDSSNPPKSPHYPTPVMQKPKMVLRPTLDCVGLGWAETKDGMTTLTLTPCAGIIPR